MERKQFIRKTKHTAAVHRNIYIYIFKYRFPFKMCDKETREILHVVFIAPESF